MRNESLLSTNAANACPAPTIAAGGSNGRDLIDSHGRKITYLRLSVTDRCDFRCTYCMTEDMKFLPRGEILSLEDALRIVRCFIDLGIDKVRITGGEPLVRRGIFWLLAEIAKLPGLTELVMTSNGSQLERHADALVAAGVKRINVSLDTLDPARFRAITRLGSLDQVMRGLDAARRAGFERIKLNAVLMRDCNAAELEDLVDFAMRQDFDISFIEEMPIGGLQRNRSTGWLSAEEALARLVPAFGLEPTGASTGGPARYWQAAGSTSKIGFITPHSHNFCADCNRVRVTARGDLYPCLGNDAAIALKPALGASANDDRNLRATIAEAIGLKSLQHEFGSPLDTPRVLRFMSATGG